MDERDPVGSHELGERNVGRPCSQGVLGRKRVGEDVGDFLQVVECTESLLVLVKCGREKKKTTDLEVSDLRAQPNKSAERERRVWSALFRLRENGRGRAHPSLHRHVLRDLVEAVREDGVLRAGALGEKTTRSNHADVAKDGAALREETKDQQLSIHHVCLFRQWLTLCGSGKRKSAPSSSPSQRRTKAHSPYPAIQSRGNHRQCCKAIR